MVLAVDNTARLCSRCHREQRDQLRTPPAKLSDDFWATDDLRAAFESQHIGRVFKAYRNHPRHLKLYGKALNQELLGRWLGLTQAQVSKLENGKPENNLEVLRNYARTLNIPQRMLWFDLPGQTRIEASASQIDLPTPRDSQVSSGNLESSPANIDIQGHDPLRRLDRLTGARSHFEQMYRNSGGLITRIRIEQFLARQSLLVMTEDNIGEDLQRKSRRALGGLVAFAGVCAYDSEDWVSANTHFAQALTVADRLEDQEFRAYVLALMTNQALALHDYKTAENLSTSALASLADSGGTPLAIDLKVMGIKALASMGDSSAALSRIHQLESSFDKAPSLDVIAEANYAQEGHLRAGLAEAFTSLGDLSAAELHAETSLNSAGHARGRVNRLASLATLEIAKGEVERASALACEMVDTAQGMESRRLVSRFIEIRNSLAIGSPGVSRDAIDKIDNVVALLQ